MIQIIQFVNTLFTSNTYILYHPDVEIVWVIDPGDSGPLLKWLGDHNRRIKGILVTHTHFDHIYGINNLDKCFPDCRVYVSWNGGLEGLKSDKINGSKYTDYPFIVEKTDVCELAEGDRLNLWEDVCLKVLETPGHSPDSLSFYVDHFLFTGDALIPNIKVVTKIKGGNKELASKTLHRFFYDFDAETVIFPGHNMSASLSEVQKSDCQYV